MERKYVSLIQAMDDLQNGDLLLFRGGLKNAIAVYGRGEWSHVAMAGQWWGQWLCLEQREFCGGRAVTLASQVKKYPERIDVFRPRNVDSRRRDQALDAMIAKMGRPYSYLNVMRCWAMHFPGLRFLRRNLKRPNLKRASLAEHCSQAFASAWREGAGIDPVPHLDDWATEPNDLARSDRFAGEYLFTLK